MREKSSEKSREKSREKSSEERILESLKRVADGGLDQGVVINPWWFGLGLITKGIIILYLLINGAPHDSGNLRVLLFIYSISWASMFFAVIWGRRIWGK